MIKAFANSFICCLLNFKNISRGKITSGGRGECPLAPLNEHQHTEIILLISEREEVK